MMYLDTPCPRCKKTQVIPPQKKELERQIILVLCEGCKKHSRYNIVHHADNTKGYTLSTYGRTGRGFVLWPIWVKPEHKARGVDWVRDVLDKALK